MSNYKKIKKIWRNNISQIQNMRVIFIIILSLTISSCGDFIDIPPKDVIDADSFFSNSNELVFAVNGVYASQRNVFGNFDYFNMIEARSDNAGQDQLDQKERVETDTFEETPGNLLLVNVWTQNYILINNANNVIRRAPEVPTLTDGQKLLVSRSIGEAKFLRAFSYFALVNMFGGIPLRTEPTSDFNNATLAKSSISDVYTLIISDLTDAVNLLPEDYPGGPFNEKGRVTRFAAYALLGKVHLQIGKKSEASTALNKVIGKFTLTGNYSEIYNPGNDNLKESIFEVNFNTINQTGLGFNNLLIPRSEAARLGIIAGGFAGRLPTFPTQDVRRIYETGDRRFSASIKSYDNNGKEELYISKYIDLAAAANGSNINLLLLRYADVLLMKAEADGESSASYELINQVRRRAFGKNPNTADPAIDFSASTPGTFLEKVMLERRRELVFEGHRFFDLKRLPVSDALRIINNHIQKEYPKAPLVGAHRLVYPIPQVEIDVSNGLITQNPGY